MRLFPLKSETFQVQDRLSSFMLAHQGFCFHSLLHLGITFVVMIDACVFSVLAFFFAALYIKQDRRSNELEKEIKMERADKRYLVRYYNIKS